tara:strand:+ start:2461 stop:2820 length:360 start_codon:yes stop_codon:yes gene_type:complete
MPLMHSEDLEDQVECVRLADQRTENELLQDYARQHLRIVERFGRFPHRNAVLGRESTADEVEFLKEEGRPFDVCPPLSASKELVSARGYTPMRPITNPMMSSTPSQWPPSMTESDQVAP